MKLLIVTQTVDLDDPVLGFFHAWLVAFARSVETIDVICLAEGRHTLPANVTVHSLGKERGRRSRADYAARFVRLIWQLRAKYDRVFVHMNEVYCLLGGWLWLLLGKRVTLWRNHRQGSWQTRVAAVFADALCYTSPSAYVAAFRRAHAMPIGIDTEQFAPGQPAERGSILFLGRLDRVKQPDIFLEAMSRIAARCRQARADVVGDPSPGRSEYADALKRQFPLPNVRYHPSVPHRETPVLYRTHEVYVNLTPSGSFDKTIGEAMASGCLPIVANHALEDAPGARVLHDTTPDSVAEALIDALALDPEELAAKARANRSYIEERHSLSLLVRRLLPLLSGPAKA